jgi:hypothetical protein
MTDKRAIAKRVLELHGHPDGQINIVLFEPYRDGNTYRCDFQIDNRPGYGMGVDEMHALSSAMQIIGTRLYTSAYYKAGKLRWHGQRNLGFPVPDILADTVPPLTD